MTSTSRIYTGEPRGLVAPWAELLRVRVAVMVFLTGALGGWLATRDPSLGNLARCAEAAFYILLVTGSASILNQVIERDLDGLMERTKNRPLVTGEVSVLAAVVVASVMGVLGTAGLALSFNLLSAVLILATLLVYVAIYTPLKRVSTLNTVIGAVPGAAPVLIGYAALAGEIGPLGWALFATIFAWQFPHFMAIAWMYRKDYALAGHKMVPTEPGSEGAAGRYALLYSLSIVPVTLMPALSGLAGPTYVIGALVLGIMYIIPSYQFSREENLPNAKRLLLVSIIYLPALMALLFIDPVLRGV
ncbi:Protoheme IX farnesyltransferase 1 [Planctomycetes bacterium Poly30]|uniref:Protoheme IX farnesyltransferase n=1 Tax=Saltatorellus ferox TaxID=2528018 RepID=A0A518EQ90_9BACT|nr:Protoheme IX farnesyltransferase 1 [Planctomycetes bacterium Poly30]